MACKKILSMQESSYVTPGEVATDLAVSRSTVHRWLHDGTLPASRFGGVWRIALEDFEAFKVQAAAR